MQLLSSVPAFFHVLLLLFQKVFILGISLIIQFFQAFWMKAIFWINYKSALLISACGGTQPVFLYPRKNVISKIVDVNKSTVLCNGFSQIYAQISPWLRIALTPIH